MGGRGPIRRLRGAGAPVFPRLWSSWCHARFFGWCRCSDGGSPVVLEHLFHVPIQWRFRFGLSSPLVWCSLISCQPRKLVLSSVASLLCLSFIGHLISMIRSVHLIIQELLKELFIWTNYLVLVWFFYYRIWYTFLPFKHLHSKLLIDPIFFKVKSSYILRSFASILALVILYVWFEMKFFLWKNGK